MGFATSVEFVTTRDEQIGRNLAALRGDVSQKELATRMKRFGWKWSQATVWTVESGERPLRLAEAQDIAEILELGLFGVDRLTRPDGDALVAMHARSTLAARDALKHAIATFRESQLQLALAADGHPPATGADQLRARSLLEDNTASVTEEVIAEDAAESAVENQRLGNALTDTEQMGGDYLQLHLSAWDLHGEHPEAS